MSIPASPQSSANSDDAVLLMLKSQEIRIAELENAVKKTLFKKLTESASASALFLGLVLTFISLYDAFVTKPEADRINRLSQFNQAVNSAAKSWQDTIQLQYQITDPQVQQAMASAAMPRILNDISTARAILPYLGTSDIGISQLIVLMSVAFTTGDLDSVKGFVTRAVDKTDVTPYLRAEAKRYEGKYLFASGDPVQGRKSYEAALSALGNSPGAVSTKAYDLGELVVLEFSSGDCGSAAADLQSLVATLKLPQIAVQHRLQMATTVKSQLIQLQGQHCPTLQNLDALLGN
jgi:hypothetical protein